MNPSTHIPCSIADDYEVWTWLHELHDFLRDTEDHWDHLGRNKYGHEIWLQTELSCAIHDCGPIDWPVSEVASSIIESDSDYAITLDIDESWHNIAGPPHAHFESRHYERTDDGLIWLLKMDGWWQPKEDADYITPDRWRSGR